MQRDVRLKTIHIKQDNETGRGERKKQEGYRSKRA